MPIRWIEPDWPAPPNIRAASSMRGGGVSNGPYASLNLGTHVGDAPGSVAENRARLTVSLGLPSEPVWLEQVHGDRTVQADFASNPQADAAWTSAHCVVCAVMTADCLPVLLCGQDGAAVAAVHAGWRGLLGGIIQSAVAAMGARDPLAWLGPAIGPEAFEVGGDVREAFMNQSAGYAPAFRQTGEKTWLADIYHLGRIVLHQAGVTGVYGGNWCTFTQPDDFFSYRRDRDTGRMASLIWRE